MFAGIKALSGVSLAGTGIIGLGIGGQYIISQEISRTIGDNIRDKTPIEYYVKSSSGNEEIKKLWTTKVDAYKVATSNIEKESILKIAEINEEKLSNRCKDILETKVGATISHLSEKVQWAREWCFASE